MGKIKTKYEELRKSIGISRDKAAEELNISADSLGNYERGEQIPSPEKVLAMSDLYKSPSLCNHYCANICEIGQKYVPAVEATDLSQIAIQLTVSLNSCQKYKDRLLEIVADDRVDEDELEDFAQIQEALENISLTVESLQLWIEKKIDEKEIDQDKLNNYRQKAREKNKLFGKRTG